MRPHRAIREVAFYALLSIWALAPLVLLVLLGYWRSCIDHPLALFTSLVLWALAALGLFGYTLLKRYRTESIESLTCTIFLGLVSISLSFVTVLGSPFNLATTFSAEGDRATLEPPRRPAKEDRTLYVAAIDLSQSTLGAGQAARQRLDLIGRTMRSIFLDDEESPGVSLRPADALRIYTLSGRAVREKDNERNGAAREDIRRALVANLPDQLADQLAAEEAPNRYSDVMGFLSYNVCSDIQSAQGKFDRVNVILFSSWEGTEVVPQVVLDRELRRVKECLIGKQPVASLLGFCLPTGTGQGALTRCGVILHALHAQLPETRWQEINLEDYDRLTPGQQIVSLEALYVHDDSPILRIKYCPNSRAESPVSTLDLPPMGPNDRAYVKLRSISGEAAPLRLDVVNGGDGPFDLSLPGGEDFKALQPGQSTLGLRLEDHLAAPRDKDFEILVAIPQQSLLYRVRLVIMPALTHSSIRALFAIAVVMHLFPVPVAIRILARRRRDQRRARPRPAPAGAYTNASPPVL